MFAIQIEHLRESETAAVFKFLVDCAVDRKSDDFEEDLLFALNLLQENVGLCGVLPAEATHAAILSSLEMSWEFFPLGTAPEVERFFGGRMEHVTPELAAIIKERTALLWRLEPVRYLRGTGGLNKYVGAQFADDLVVFENVNYGNAVQILFEAWPERLLPHRPSASARRALRAYRAQRWLAGPPYRNHRRREEGTRDQAITPRWQGMRGLRRAARPLGDGSRRTLTFVSSTGAQPHLSRRLP